ncbi:MAG: hypothetical protein NC120_01110 [Ruminococcus sp.]|nr:hypothetical protein [Ruminococcus sp.]
MNIINKRRAGLKRRAFSPGFTTILMIFLAVCLITAGAMSLAATGRGGKLTDASAAHMKLYTEACCESEKRLAEADGMIASAAGSGIFDMNFPALIAEREYFDCSFDGKNYTVSCSTPIDDKTSVYWEILVNAFPQDNRGGYELISRRIADNDAGSEEEEHLNVWLG